MALPFELLKFEFGCAQEAPLAEILLVRRPPLDIGMAP